jgi:hypothetical protein
LDRGSACHKATAYTQTSMPQLGFEPTTPVFEWVKTIYALDCAGTMIGPYLTLPATILYARRPVITLYIYFFVPVVLPGIHKGCSTVFR